MMTLEADEYLMHRRKRPVGGIAIDQPGELGYLCPRLHGGPALEWSEWADHLWCYTCGVDWPSSECPKMRPAGMSDKVWELVNRHLPFTPVILPGPYPWTDW
jgi:hypothetical protein